jgi:adenylate cyclase
VEAEKGAIMSGCNETHHAPNDIKLMPLEIERKFLLSNDSWKSRVARRIRIRDGLIASNNGNKARVRISDSAATITLKSRRRGATRTEFEYVIPYSDAVEMLRTMCDGHVLDKVRHVIIHAGTVWHVDVYEGILNGVVMAEVELPHADQKFDLPGWIGKEVTGDPRYRKINMRTQRIVGLPERTAAVQMTVN